MRVADRQRWTSTKKKVAVVMSATGLFMGFGLESSLWWAVPALVLTYSGCLIINSIHPHEW